MESQRNNNNNNSQNRRGARPSVGYLLFQYQSELTRRHAEPTRLSRTKIHIIDGLVSRTIRQLKHCSVEELQACKRELVYKEQLRDELRTMRRRKSSSFSLSSSSSSSLASGSADHPSAVRKAPNTPPKPRVAFQTKVTIFGPEIFV
ncbi:uncharacterized protein LOC135429082 [Drosophila montana]|uniref:uncharacterized protein LOC135429082 n=1 Tax=Drosophila montana TaxID=40370 RepID=UPI00313E5F67